MTNKKIYLSSPHMGGNEIKYVKDAIDTNWVAPLGPNVNGFEDELAAYNGISHCAALSSGTAALHLALILLGIKQKVECPRCKTKETELVSQFSSTACKAMYRCTSCLEPFEYFKCL